MPIEFQEDLSPFFTAEAFAEAATVGGVTLLAIFDDGYKDDQGVEGTDPQLTCRSNDLPASLAQGDAATVGGHTYVVTGIRPDGSGVTHIDLDADP